MQIKMMQMIKKMITLPLNPIFVITIGTENITMKIILMMNVIITSPRQPCSRCPTWITNFSIIHWVVEDENYNNDANNNDANDNDANKNNLSNDDANNNDTNRNDASNDGATKNDANNNDANSNYANSNDANNNDANDKVANNKDNY